MPEVGMFGRLAPPSRTEFPRPLVDDYVNWEYRASLPKPTLTVNRTVSTWPMYLNDQIGDCTEAAKGHMIQALSAVGEGKELTVTNKQVLSWYERDGGYVPGNPSTDNGCQLSTVLANWKQYDSAVCQITEFAELASFYEIANLKEALYLFGTVYLGIYVPQSAVDQYHAGEPWTYVPGSQIVGGHAICLQEVLAPGNDNMLQVVTWGQLWPMDREFFWHYCEEAWVMISPDWFNSSGVDTDGFNMAELQSDFSEMTA